MNFIKHQNRQPFFLLRWVFIFLFIILFFALNGQSFIARGFIMISKNFSFFQNNNSSDEITILKAKINDLETEQSRLNILLNTRDAQKIVPARVTISGEYLFADSIIIDRGLKDAVAPGDFVTTSEGMFVGLVTTSETYGSRIIPFTQLGQKTVIRGGKNKEIIFEARGIGGGEASADLPVNIDIKVGDIFWSGEYPDFIIGIIHAIDRSPARQIETVYLKPPIAFKFLTSVYVHKKH